MTDPTPRVAKRSVTSDDGEHREHASADVAPELFEHAAEDGRR